LGDSNCLNIDVLADLTEVIPVIVYTKIHISEVVMSNLVQYMAYSTHKR